MGSRSCGYFTRERSECESRIYAAIVQKCGYTVFASTRYCTSYPKWTLTSNRRYRLDVDATYNTDKLAARCYRCLLLRRELPAIRCEIRCYLRAEVDGCIRGFPNVDLTGMSGFYGNPRTSVVLGVGSTRRPTHELPAKQKLLWAGH
jgi:hypothetical protein